MPLQSESSLEKMVSESNNDKFSDAMYIFSKPTRLDTQKSLGRTIEQTRERGKADKCVVWKKTLKSKRKKEKNKPQPSSAKAGMNVSTTTPADPSSKQLVQCRNARDTVMPGTVWRNVCFDTAPINLLPLESNVALPFYSDFDRPLLIYGMLPVFFS